MCFYINDKYIYFSFIKKNISFLKESNFHKTQLPPGLIKYSSCIELDWHLLTGFQFPPMTGCGFKKGEAEGI